MNKALRICTFLIVFPALVYSSHSFPDIQNIPECRYCGMDRSTFAHSRVLLKYADGRSEGVCSLNCAALDYLKDVNESPVKMRVGDYDTKELLDCEEAVWVIGGNRQGVMTERAKWAFRNRQQALAFIKNHGGELATFESAIRETYVDMHEDMRRLAQMKEEYARTRSR